MDVELQDCYFEHSNSQDIIIDTYDVNVVRSQLLQTRLNTDVKTFRMVAGVIAVYRIGIDLSFEACRILHDHISISRQLRYVVEAHLRSNDHLISYATLLHPLADPHLALFVLVVVGRIQKVATILVKVVEDLKDCLLRALTHE